MGGRSSKRARGGPKPTLATCANVVMSRRRRGGGERGMCSRVVEHDTVLMAALSIEFYFVFFFFIYMSINIGSVCGAVFRAQSVGRRWGRFNVPVATQNTSSRRRWSFPPESPDQRRGTRTVLMDGVKRDDGRVSGD